MTELTPSELSAAVDDLTAAVHDLQMTMATVSEHTATALAVSAKANRRTTTTRWFGLVFGVAALVIMATSVVVNRESTHVIESIKDCTEVGGRCFTESRARTAKDVDGLVQVICDAVPPERRRPPCPVG
jgi:hypothetical protein